MAEELVNAPWQERLYVPCYPLKVAASLSGTKAGNVSYWLRERAQSRAVIPGRTAFWNLSWMELVEVAFVSTMRHYGVSLQRIRRARDYLARAYGVEYPFAELRLKTDGAHILKEANEADGGPGVLVVADEQGQLAWERILAERYAQFIYERNLALVWYPLGKEKPISLDPRVAFGMPAVRGVPTRVISSRFMAGDDDLKFLGEDYGLDLGLVIQALAFEGVGLKQ